MAHLFTNNSNMDVHLCWWKNIMDGLDKYTEILVKQNETIKLPDTNTDTYNVEKLDYTYVGKFTLYHAWNDPQGYCSENITRTIINNDFFEWKLQ